MGELLEKAYDKIFHTHKTVSENENTVIDFGLRETSLEYTPRTRRVEACLIGMSYPSLLELKREDVNGHRIAIHARPGMKPETLFGVRIAIDDALELGEFKIAERLY